MNEYLDTENNNSTITEEENENRLLKKKNINSILWLKAQERKNVFKMFYLKTLSYMAVKAGS